MQKGFYLLLYLITIVTPFAFKPFDIYDEVYISDHII